MFLGSNRSWSRDFGWSERFLDSVEVVEFSTPEELRALLNEYPSPSWVFFAFWSNYVGKEVYSIHRSVIFHMTDLPYGRGGSPLQNLILAGHKKTKLSAIVCTETLDAGDVYLKRDLALGGTASEIYARAAGVIREMVEEIVLTNPTPEAQKGEVVEFRRRKPEESRLPETLTAEALYDFIRMLDAEGYPRAYVTVGDLKLTFQDAELSGGRVTARVQVDFIRKEN